MWREFVGLLSFSRVPVVTVLGLLYLLAGSELHDPEREDRRLASLQDSFWCVQCIQSGGSPRRHGLILVQ